MREWRRRYWDLVDGVQWPEHKSVERCQVKGGDIPVFRSGYTAGETEAGFVQKIARVWVCY